MAGVMLARRGATARGATSTLDPTTISGLRIYEVDSLSALANNDPVSSWTDKSASGDHLVQATSGAQPLYKTNIGDGTPGVSFDGSDDYLGVTRTVTQPFRAWIVCKFRGSGGVNKMFFGNTVAGGPGFNGASWKPNASNVVELYLQSAGLQTAGTTAPLDAWHLWRFRANGASSTIIRETTQLADGSSTNPGTGGLSGWRVGGNQGAGGGWADVDIKAFYMAVSDLTTQQESDLLTYVRAKYAV